MINMVDSSAIIMRLSHRGVNISDDMGGESFYSRKQAGIDVLIQMFGFRRTHAVIEGNGEKKVLTVSYKK